MKKFGIAFVLLLVSIACGATDTVKPETPSVNPETSSINPADLVLHNGAIYTVNERQPWAESVAIKDGVFAFVGSDEDIEAYIGTSTRVIDMQGKTVLPGLHDVHQHPLEAGSPVAGTCILDMDADPEAMIPIIQDCAPNQIGTDWVMGWGHSIYSLLESDRSPREILDEAVPDRPAIMLEQTSHSVWINSAALQAAGIDASTPDPPGGVILHDPGTGEPNGILLDNAGNMLIDLALAPTPELLDLHYEGLLYSLDELAKNGITSVADARTYWGRGYHEVWLRAEREDALTVRTVLGLWAYPHFEDAEQLETLKALYRNDPESLLRISQIKLYSDGLLGNTTAAVFEPYLFDLEFTADNLGLNYFEENRLTDYIIELEQAGFDFHIHTIGDRGVHESLNAIEAAMAANGNSLDRRHRLTHLELIGEADRSRFFELGVIADFQAGTFTLPEFYAENEEVIGERAFDVVPIRSIYDTGAVITLSSDWDVNSLSPFVGIQNALSRGEGSLPGLEAAIAAYTINGAYVMRQEGLTGSIEVGKYADLVVIDQDMFEIPIDRIGETIVLLTLLEGEAVFRHASINDWFTD